MNKFSRLTIVKAFDLLKDIYRYHTQVDRFRLLFGFEDIGPQGSVDRATKLLRIAEYLIRNPDEKGPEGASLTFEIIEFIIKEAKNHYYDSADVKDFIELENSLKRDGYIIEGNKLKTALPEIVELPKQENELFSLLNQFGFNNEEGHLNQAISAHARGDWASANAQLRSFIEGLFDSIAEKLAQNQGALPQPGHPSRTWLSNNPAPAFFQANLNEWQGDGKGFVQGLFKRLHPQGSHPGLSDEEDSTFRLHLVLLTGLHYLRRFKDRI